MPFEPISVVSCLSIILALLNFATTGVSKIANQADDFKDSKRLILWSYQQFTFCYGRLKAWTELWTSGSRPWSERTYVYYWSEDGFMEVQSRIQVIGMECDKLGHMLFKDLDLKHDKSLTINWNVWAGIVPTLKRAGKKIDPSWLNKIWFAIHEKQSLEERVRRLQEMVKQLEQYTEDIYWEHRSRLRNTGRITAGLLRQDHRRERWLSDHWTALEKFYNSVVVSRTSWELVLRLPDNTGKIECMDTDTPLSIRFSIYLQASQPDRIDTLGLWSFEYNELDEQKLGEFGSGPRSIHMPTESLPPLKEMLLQIQEDVLLARHYGRKFSELSRAETAVGLVNWIMLLWTTQWTSALCSCCLRLIYVPPREWTCTLKSTGTGHIGTACNVHSFSTRKMLLLAIAIAEIGLGRAITICEDGADHLSFSVAGSVYDKRALLREICKACSEHYRNAVEYCFDMDEETKPGHIFRSQDLLDCREHILNP